MTVIAQFTYAVGITGCIHLPIADTGQRAGTVNRIIPVRINIKYIIAHFRGSVHTYFVLFDISVARGFNPASSVSCPRVHYAVADEGVHPVNCFVKIPVYHAHDKLGGFYGFPGCNHSQWVERLNFGGKRKTAVILYC